MKYNLMFCVFFALNFASCTSNQNQKNQPTPSEEVNIRITGYSNEFELYAEADPFAVGKSSNILSHFSHLPDFKALEKGSITLRLIVNGQESIQTLTEPTRKGIYSFDLIPEKVGTGKLEFEIITEKGEFHLTVQDVIVFNVESDAKNAAKNVILSTTNTTIFTKEQSWKIDFATEQPKLETIGKIIKTVAQIQSAQGDEELLSAKTNGIVKYTGDNVLEGKAVSRGKELFSISGSNLADNNLAVRYLEAQNNYEKAQADYKRLSILAKDKIVSEKKFLEAKNQYDNAKVIYDNLNKNFSANGQRVKSLINGFVKEIYVQNGQYVEAGQPIVTISQNKTLIIQAEVQQKYATILRTINSANIRTLHNNRTYSLKQLNGKIISFGKNTNSDNYLVPISIQIDNQGDFLPGGFVEIDLIGKTNTKALTIPNSAIMEEQGIYFVFVQSTPELFEKREVKVGVNDGLNTEILNGVTEHDRIVTLGAIQVKLAQATGTLDANSGHNH